MIDGHTRGKYLDDRSYDPFWSGRRRWTRRFICIRPIP